jgi:phosphatidylglycerophosphate synthase
VDLADGTVARAKGQKSLAGTYLDSFVGLWMGFLPYLALSVALIVSEDYHAASIQISTKTIAALGVTGALSSLLATTVIYRFATLTDTRASSLASRAKTKC